MGKGTTGLNSAPVKKLIYGDTYFHLRPIYQGKNKAGEDQYFFALRPAANPDYLVEIEGEFGMGERSYQFEKSQVRAGCYKNVKYVYYKHDLEKASDNQIKMIKAWAVDGAL